MKAIIATCGELGLSTLTSIHKELSIIALLTDHSSKQVIDWSREKKIPLFIGNPRKNEFSKKMRELGDVDLLISINYLFIFDKEMIDLARIISMNIHGGMLPLYRGRGPHVRAIMNGEKEMGITLHKIDEGCDTGDIILQRALHLNSEITAGEVLLKLPEIYSEMILKSLEMIKNAPLKLRPQDHAKATYYEKLKPEERKINWSHSAIQIKDFVRALAPPYLGAYTFLKGRKLIIWKAEALQESTEKEVGTLIDINKSHLIVQTGDRAIRITHYEFLDNEKVILHLGDKFKE